MITRWSSESLPILSNMLESLFEGAPAANSPAINVCETDENFRIEVAAPGLRKEDFKVNLDNNVLTISSEKETRNDDKNERVYEKGI